MFRKTNPKVPRFHKHRFIHKVVSKELYEQWLGENPEYQEVSYQAFEDVWKLIAEKIRAEVTAGPDGVRLPFYSGDLYVRLVDMLTRTVDIKRSGQKGDWVAHPNWNTNRFPGKICWSTRHSRLRNKWTKLYGFAPHYLFKRETNKALQETPEVFKINADTAFNAGVRISQNKKLSHDGR